MKRILMLVLSLVLVMSLFVACGGNGDNNDDSTESTTPEVTTPEDTSNEDTSNEDTSEEDTSNEDTEVVTDPEYSKFY